MSRMTWNNPVLSSEMKIKMRGWRTALGIAAYLGIILLVGFLYYLAFVQQSLSWNTSINARQSAGMEIYTMLSVLQFGLILLITPAQTAGTISSEREKQTLDLLLSTRMSHFGIIFGKLLSSMSYMVLLIITSIPLFSLVFLFGGVTPGDMVKLFFFYIITAFSVGSIGIFFSTLFKKTVAATVMTYLFMFMLGLISVILGIYMISVQYNVPNPPQTPSIPFVLYVNPAVGLADILSGQSGGLFYMFGFRMNQAMQGMDFWILNSIVMLVIALCLLLVSVYRINPVRHLGRRKQQPRGR
jgi:ABC-2 type transport system permease protein